jgi:hypothetical protein
VTSALQRILIGLLSDPESAYVRGQEQRLGGSEKVISTVGALPLSPNVTSKISMRSS